MLKQLRRLLYAHEYYYGAQDFAAPKSGQHQGEEIMAGFNTAVTGIKATTTALDVAGNNIANASTVGFKATRAEFSDIYSTQVVGAGSSNVAGAGVLVSDLAQDFSSGTIEFTNSNLDLAVNGSGFFQLNDGQGGITYTRGGAFELDKEGYIVSKNGKNLRGYGLDTQGNQLPITNLQVEEKESRPHTTENIALSVNLKPAAELDKQSDYYSKTSAASYSYTTTVETYDSLGNTQAIKFNYVEQKAQREFYEYTLATQAVDGDPTADPLVTTTADVVSISGVPVKWDAVPSAAATAAGTAATTAATDAATVVTQEGAVTTAETALAAAIAAAVGVAAAQATLTAAQATLATNKATAAASAAAAAAAEIVKPDSDSIDKIKELDPRVDTDTISYNVVTKLLSYKLKSEATGQGDMFVTQGPASQTPSNINSKGQPALVAANETLNVPLNPALFSATGGLLAAAVTVNLGGLDIPLASGINIDTAGETIAAQETAMKDNDPNIESVAWDAVNNQVVITWKAEAGDVYQGGAGSEYQVDGNTADDVDANSVFTATGGAGDGKVDVTIVEGDSSYLGTYRVYAYLNDSQLLDIGKSIDPGESSNGKNKDLTGGVSDFTEPGPVIIKFSSQTGIITEINGDTVNDPDNVPKLVIRGADQANPNDDVDSETDEDGLAGVQLDISGSTRWESASIVKGQDQDGYSKGDLIGVSFDGDGTMVASYSNGQKKNIGIVALATFESQAGLQPAGDTEWVPTLDSGQASLNPPGTGLNGSLRSGALEQSNVDLSSELVKLIEFQRNYQANSKTLETLNTVTQSILQI